RANGLPLPATELHQSRTFSEVTPGQAFWYANANGLVEIAVNQGSAAQELNLTPGTSMTLL
ncbi:MAG: SAM hydroxide adenosyltransferase, partial [Alphaproteobacteria bacterium]